MVDFIISSTAELQMSVQFLFGEKTFANDFIFEPQTMDRLESFIVEKIKDKSLKNFHNRL